MSQIIVLDTHIWFWLINQEFDRMIIATAIEYQAKLASVDGIFDRYPELSDRLMLP